MKLKLLIIIKFFLKNEIHFEKSMKLLIQLLLIISISPSLKLRKFLNLKYKIFFSKFYEFSKLDDDYGYPIPLFNNDGILTEDGYAYYSMFSRTVNGEKIGTVITAETAVGNNFKYGYARINDYKYISEHKYLVDIVHKNDADIILKIVNFLEYNSENNFYELNETKIIPIYNEKITEIMKKEDIIKIENDFVSGVLRAKQSGYDGVLISLNGDKGNNLLNCFLSPLINKRKDEYGENITNNRAKILKEIIEKIRIELGYEFPLGLVIPIPDGYLGINDDDIITASKIAEKSGIDFIQIDTEEESHYKINEYDENKPLEFIKKLSENIKKIPITIFKRGILEYKDLKTLAEIGIKF